VKVVRVEEWVGEGGEGRVRGRGHNVHTKGRLT